MLDGILYRTVLVSSANVPDMYQASHHRRELFDKWNGRTNQKIEINGLLGSLWHNNQSDDEQGYVSTNGILSLGLQKKVTGNMGETCYNAAVPPTCTTWLDQGNNIPVVPDAKARLCTLVSQKSVRPITFWIALEVWTKCNFDGYHTRGHG